MRPISGAGAASSLDENLLTENPGSRRDSRQPSSPKLSDHRPSVRFVARKIERLLRVDPAACTRDQRFDCLAEIDAVIARAQAGREVFLASVHDPRDEKEWAREGSHVSCGGRLIMRSAG